MIRKNKRRIAHIVFVLLILLFIFTYLSMIRYFNSSKQAVFDEYIEMLSKEYKITTSIYTDLSNLIYDTSINIDSVKKLFTEGVKSSGDEQNILRKQLFTELSVLYSVLNNYNFRQFHFHDKNNLSYLRFHRPDMFGDNLTDVRYSVKYVNNTQQSISGFEEGRIFNGYRYVYPLSYNGEHIGSVEISISMKTIIDHLDKLYGQETQFILNKSIMEEKVFDSEQSNYIPWTIDDQFVMDRGISDTGILEGRISEKQVIKLRNLINKNHSSGKAFSTEIRYKKERVILTFIPITNFLDENVAYLFSLSDNTQLIAIRNAFTVVSIIYICLFILTLIMVRYYITEKIKIEKMEKTDHLTRTDTRRVLMEKLENEGSRFFRYKRPFSIIMIDIDLFKQINDVYGHLKGDEVLRELSNLVQQNIRSTDSLGRFGGEEFIISLPETALPEAVRVAENIRKIVENYNFIDSKPVTVSMGVAEVFEKLNNINEVIEKADQNLYRAKRSGRNKVCY